jgi:hypothetical protein
LKELSKIENTNIQVEWPLPIGLVRLA